MQKPTIVFCPKHKAEVVSNAMGVLWIKSRSILEGLHILNSNGTILIDDDTTNLVGWTAPPNTQLLFIEGFPAEGTPTRIQAEGRVSRLNPDSHVSLDRDLRLKLDKRIYSQRLSLRQAWGIINGHIRSRRSYSLFLIKTINELCDRYNIPKGGECSSYTQSYRVELLKQKIDALLAD